MNRQLAGVWITVFSVLYPMNICPCIRNKRSKRVQPRFFPAVVLMQIVAFATTLVRITNLVKSILLCILGVKQDTVVRGLERFPHRGGGGFPRNPMPKISDLVQKARIVMSAILGCYGQKLPPFPS